MSLPTSLWDKCLGYLRDEIPPQQYNTWIRPLHAIESKQNGLLLLAPNRFVLDWINERFLNRITELLDELSDTPPQIRLQIGSRSTEMPTKNSHEPLIEKQRLPLPVPRFLTPKQISIAILLLTVSSKANRTN